MVKQTMAKAIFKKFFLVSVGNQKFYFINNQTQEKSSEFKDKKEGLKILHLWNEEVKISNSEELDLITLLFKRNELPFLFFSGDPRENFSDRTIKAVLDFSSRMRILKNLEKSKKTKI